MSTLHRVSGVVYAAGRYPVLHSRSRIRDAHLFAALSIIFGIDPRMTFRVEWENTSIRIAGQTEPSCRVNNLMSGRVRLTGR